jgi:hypothetical protein
MSICLSNAGTVRSMATFKGIALKSKPAGKRMQKVGRKSKEGKNSNNARGKDKRTQEPSRTVNPPQRLRRPTIHP